MISRTGVRESARGSRQDHRAITTGHLGCGAVTCGHPNRQVRWYQGTFRSDFQADSAGSIPVTRAWQCLPSSGRSSAIVAASPLRPLGMSACPLAARSASDPGAAGPSQFSPGHLVERACELTVPLLSGMQVHPRGPRGGVAHPVH
jgi:hypothetical protein